MFKAIKKVLRRACSLQPGYSKFLWFFSILLVLQWDSFFVDKDLLAVYSRSDE